MMLDDSGCVAEEKLERGETLSSNDAVKCRDKIIMRPSMEACSIDVFWILENAGFSLKVLRDYSENVDIFGLVLG